jgi:hypothetical protein
VRLGEARVERDGALEAGDGLVVPPALEQGATEVAARPGGRGIDAQRVLVVLDRLVETAGPLQGVAEIVVCARQVGRGGERRPVLGDGLVRSARGEEAVAEVEGGRAARPAILARAGAAARRRAGAGPAAPSPASACRAARSRTARTTATRRARDRGRRTDAV